MRRLQATEADTLRDLEKLRAFAQFILKNWPDDFRDEFEIQDKAVELGLLEGHEATEPCGENCWCEEYTEFPVTCYRRTKILTGET